MKKIALIASSGGHLEQLMMLRPLSAKFDTFTVTEKTGYSAGDTGNRVYYLKQVNRREWKFIPLMIANTFISLRILLREKPDAVICTGALATVPFCLLARRVFRKKLIFIESFAKVTDGTITGRLMYKHADLFIVQWESMLKVYPKAKYLGGIY
ncbi:MAG: polysaccharide biosynthesis protein [Clostridia bacterium]|nr:polysaccharide biosynthesis protein [Clostridia bacterium]